MTRKEPKLTSKITACELNENRKRNDADKKKLASVGEIIIKVYRKSYGKAAKPTGPPKLARNPKEVSEVVLKGKTLSHGTRYSIPLTSISLSLSLLPLSMSTC